MSSPAQATRAAVAEMWQGVVDGTVSRADAHRWAKRWVEGDDPDVSDPMVWSALQRLHGFDLVWTDAARTTVRHGGDGVDVHSMREIQAALVAWRAACERYDADPAEYVRRMKEAARSAGTE
jgi:glutathione S-transferase